GISFWNISARFGCHATRRNSAGKYVAHVDGGRTVASSSAAAATIPSLYAVGNSFSHSVLTAEAPSSFLTSTRVISMCASTDNRSVACDVQSALSGVRTAGGSLEEGSTLSAAATPSSNCFLCEGGHG